MKFLSKSAWAALCFLVIALNTSWAQTLTSYYSRYRFLPVSASVSEGDLVGFVNPATIGLISGFQSRFYWIANREDPQQLKSWGLYSAVPGLGFSVQRDAYGPLRVTDYQFASGFGDRSASFGFSYQWSKGDTDLTGRENLFTLGSILRPSPFLSIGLAGRFSGKSSAKEASLDIGLRPLKDERLTLFADAALQKGQSLSEAPWSVGANLQLLQGVFFSGRYFEDESFTLGVQLALGVNRLSSQAHFDDRQERSYNSYSVGFGDYHPSVFQSWFQKGQQVVKLNLKGRVDYQTFRLFDEGTHRFADLLQTIRQSGQDERVGVIALNLSGMRIRPELGWELREALKTARAAGKKVVIFIDNVRLSRYHLASVADQVVLDPQGMIMLPGFVMGRTYFKATLEKLGLGFDEWRFFKYKSAVEVLSRDNFSEADREQFQAYLDDWYEVVRGDICQSRGFTTAEFDRLIDEETIFLPKDALRSGLVDTLGRWNDMDQIVQRISGKKLTNLPYRAVKERADFYGEWGEPPRIALVYALGICAMDEGIRARWLSKALLRIAKDRRIKAVVFRVDSPGGDGMASDIVAEALKKVSEKKPVVVSQGQVAGSGGYWISMYGDTILAGPNTVTGSIGVIGGWLYDKGISQKLGMSSDFVKRGKHAEVGFGIRLPLLNLKVPARNLTGEERRKVEQLLNDFYREFIAKVSQGRGMSVARVDSVAQGRFYSGLDGKDLGLVDEIGGLLTAVSIAKEMAGLSPGDRVKILEIPRYKGLWNTDLFSPLGIKSAAGDDPIYQYLEMVSEKPGAPLPLMTPGYYPTEEE